MMIFSAPQICKIRALYIKVGTEIETLLITHSILEVCYMFNIDNLPPVLRVKDLITLLGISHNTAYELVRSNKIHSFRIGRSYRITREAIAEYISKYA